MSKSLSKLLKIVIPLALGIFLVIYSYLKFTPEQLAEIQQYFQKADYGFVALSVALSILSHMSRAYRWNYLLQPLGYRPHFLNNFMAISIAYLMNLFIPKSGEISRGVVINKYEGIPFDKGFGTIISERVVDLLFLFLLTLLALSLEFDTLYGFLTSEMEPQKIFYLLGAMVAVGIIFLAFLKLSNSTLRNKIVGFLKGLKEGVLSIFKMKHKIAFLFHTVLIWSLYLLSFYVALFALPETTNIPLGTIIIAFVVGSFSFAFTNSGFGTYPVFVAGILALFGISLTAGTAFGWIVWSSNIASIIVFGGLSFLFLPLFNKNRIAREG
ncbi:flippase-like domain-containing protein [Flavobacteriaceae bacterium TK19130]|nr:flippase-like domain-containing protein [Thermobacterium salinum]